MSNLAGSKQKRGERGRRRLPVAERRTLLLETAGRLFGERGYEHTRLDDVAAAAGVTKPVVYRHFESKRDLYLALLERHRVDLSSFADAIPDEGSDAERLRAVLDVWLAYVEEHAYQWKMLFRDSGGGEEIVARRQRVNDRAREVLVDIIRGWGRADVPERELRPLAELMSMGMASTVLWWIEDPSASREAVLDAITRAWTGVLTVRPE